jgi:hypothetical protein
MAVACDARVARRSLISAAQADDGTDEGGDSENGVEGERGECAP